MAPLIITRSKADWVGNCIVAIIFTIVIFRLLNSELKQRKQATVSFTTKWLKIFSISCIFSSFLSQLFYLIVYIPPLCTIMYLFCALSSLICGLSMGFYQLARLHYCFANEQIHSNKGYPKWVFITMYLFGTIMCFISLILIVLSDNSTYGFINSRCEYAKNGDLYIYTVSMPIIPAAKTWYFIVFPCVVSWDILTLALYACKINVFLRYKDKTSDSVVYKRIMGILNRITILTLFYIIMIAMGMAINAFVMKFKVIAAAQFTRSLVIFSYSYSMYLMMDHNQNKYTNGGLFIILNYIGCVVNGDTLLLNNWSN